MIPPKKETGAKTEIEREIPKAPRHTKSYWANIPRHEVEALARCLFPDIQAFFDSEEGKHEFEEWQAQQKRNKKIT